ncbi:hypothetical protein RchiOBHm_Chr2g0144581 [Rosa chinensis]|uniref:Uncharacterized protein n=1 Tax=Rosa chinensis TaxID=74649 RepID=A0A2P6RYE8_ROSCH|nr:hypothetical protein RchiOBHm_Chr2g0144581 [Rosa chinensis]
MKPFVECIYISEIASRNYNPIRDLPIKLLQNLNSCCFLALQSQTQFCSHFSNQIHTAIEIGVDA